MVHILHRVGVRTTSPEWIGTTVDGDLRQDGDWHQEGVSILRMLT